MVVDVVGVVVSGVEVVVVEEVVGKVKVVVVVVVSVLGTVEVDVEVAMAVSVLGAAGKPCVSLVVVVSGNVGEEVPASCVVGIVSELAPSWLSSSLDEHAAASRIAATHIARMFLNTSFLANFIYDTHLSFLPQRKHRFLSL